MPNPRKTKKSFLTLNAPRRRNKGADNLRRWREVKAKQEENSLADINESQLGISAHKDDVPLSKSEIYMETKSSVINNCSTPKNENCRPMDIDSAGMLNTEVSLPPDDRVSISSSRCSDSDGSDWLAGIELIPDGIQESRNEPKNDESSKEMPLSGRRIVNLSHFINSIQSLEIHEPFNCKFSDMYLVKDRQIGFIDELTFECKVCRKTEKITTDVLPNEQNIMSLNASMVEGMTNIGQGYNQLEELCCSLDMPCMSTQTYNKYQQLLYSAVHECSWESMAEAAQEEAELAIKEGRVDKETGTPEITVVVDGAWSKRSYKTNYNALSGVACIMGLKTKKVLFVGVRNSYCCICARAESKKIQPTEHVCYKNWTKSSTAMEADIIVEGFKKSIEMYNLKYTNVIGDGDSSVMTKLTECQPYGSRTTILKIECTNHLLRNYIRKLREVGNQKRNHLGPVPGEIRDKVLGSLMRLRHAVTGAVKHNKKNASQQHMHETLKKLKCDILNGPKHVFGDHSQCQPYFCQKQKDGENNYVETMKSYGVWQEIMAANAYLSNFTFSLLQCVTSNIAESYNAKICKLVGGKRVNLVQRNSYTARSELSALAMNESEEVHRRIHKKLSLGQSPGLYSKMLASRRFRKKTKRWKPLFRNHASKKQRITNAADKDYGDVPPLDMDPDGLQLKQNDFLKSLHIDEKCRKQLELDSRGQSTSELWKHERKKRLTASNFGKICKMKPNTPCQKTVEQLLYKEFAGTKATRYGLENERVAITELENLLGVQVDECGLFVDQTLPFLAASPDGVIDDKGLVEVKCPAVAKDLTPAEAVRQKKITFCKLNEEGDLSLKRNHSYFYQVQGQLHITRKKFCLFVVWTPNGLSVEKILKDDEFWAKQMEKPLRQFYFKCILPELVDPRYPRGLPIRDRF